jgi:hypothetical protein
MQTMRLEQKDGSLIAEIKLPANGEPDAIEYGGRFFIRRAMKQTEPPQKNNPETYFEATTHHLAAADSAPKFDKVTEGSAPERLVDAKVEAMEPRGESKRAAK